MSASPLHHIVPANGINMHVLEWPGPRPDAPVALLLHGLTSCAETWSLVAPELSQDLRVLALDLRGHGETDKPDHGYEPHSLVADVVGAMDHLEISEVAVAGHSWGCGVSLGLAADYPGRVRRLALLDGGYARPPRAEEPTPEQLEAMLAPPEIYRTVDTYFAEVRRTLNDHWSPEIERIALASIYHNPDGSVREKLSREHQKLILSGNRGSNEERFGRVQCPTLLLPADNLRMPPDRREAKRAMVQGTAKLLQEARLAWVDDAVHDIQLLRPKVVIRELRLWFGGE